MTPPPIFRIFAVLVLITALAAITLAVAIAPQDNLELHFREGGLVTVLSSVLLAMSAALSLVIFYLRMEPFRPAVLFWLLLSGAMFFFAVDEILEIHELLGDRIEDKTGGDPRLFRNWNDIVVIVYGLSALVFFWFFRAEIIRCARFAQFLVIAFCLYAIHTIIDSAFSNRYGALKTIPEESAKLLCGAFLFLAISAALLAHLRQLAERGKDGAQTPE